MKSAHPLSFAVAPKPAFSVPPSHPAASPNRAPLKIAAIGGRPEEAHTLEQLCRSILGDELERFVVTDFPSAASGSFDVVLVDPDGTPDQHLDRLVRRTGDPSRCILVSSHSELAVAAFDCGVLDFVSKPVERDRLARSLARVRRVAATGPDEVFLAVRQAGRIDLVPLDDVLYVEGADKYSELVLANGRRNFHDSALGDLEASLPSSFVRIHKSFLVRFAMVSRLLVRRGSRYYAELKNGQRLPVGRSRYRDVKSRLLWPDRHG